LEYRNLASFSTFAPFSLLSETTMSPFFGNGILLLLFDNLRTNFTKAIDQTDHSRNSP